VRVGERERERARAREGEKERERERERESLQDRDRDRQVEWNAYPTAHPWNRKKERESEGARNKESESDAVCCSVSPSMCCARAKERVREHATKREYARAVLEWCWRYTYVQHEVDTISRLLQSIGLFCKRAL